MKIWLDALTPKQLLFSEYIMRRAGSSHTFLFTSRAYREVEELARMRNLEPSYMGRFGGGEPASKLDASLERARLLSDTVQEFDPDASVAFGSPEAARVSFGLATPHISFCNSPHAEAACRLSIPLSARVLIPSVIPKSAVSIYGIPDSRIVQYGALDEAAIMQNPPPAGYKLPAGIGSRPFILFRAYETQASYVHHATDMERMIGALTRGFPGHDIVVSGRYPGQIRDHASCTVLDGAVDGGTILDKCDMFVGSGGTMTTEAVLRGVRTISYQAVPSIIESHLVERGALVRARDPPDIVSEGRRLLNADRSAFMLNAERMLRGMEDIYHMLENRLREATGHTGTL